MFKDFFYLIYQFALHPFMLVVMIFISPFNKKAKKSLILRFPKGGIPQWKKAMHKNSQPLWFHCASGEFEYMKSILRHIKQQKPAEKIMVTFSSPTYQQSIESNDDVDFSFALPFDFPATIQEMIRFYKPQVLAIARTDVWPEMIRQASLNHIPSILFSATCGKPWPFLKRIWDGVTYSYIDQIFSIDQDDKLNFIKSGVEESKIKAHGDSRFDQAFYRVQSLKNKDWSFLTSEEPILIAGSTWPEDELVLIPAISDLLKYKKIKMIIAPHEPSTKHLDSIKAHLEKFDLSYSLLSETENFDSKVVIVDQVGVLAELYPFAQLAFIGGSFKKKVHSVMEALVSGCKVCVGPYYQNNREAIKYQKIENSVTSISDSKQLENWVRSHLKYKNKLLEKVNSEKGSSLKIANIILETKKGPL